MTGLHWIIAIISSLILVLIVIYMLQEKLIFIPRSLPADHQFQFTHQIPFEELTVSADDGTKLHGLLFQNSPQPKGLLFYLHGNANSAQEWGEIAVHYAGTGFDLFIADYRGYGKSGGKIRSQDQFFEDAGRFYDELVTQYETMVVIGYSVGTAPAAWLGANRNPAKIILKAPFSNLMDIKRRHYPLLPSFLMMYTFPTDEFLAKTTAPITIFHGDNDSIIPIESSAQLKPILKPDDQYITLAGQTHAGMNWNPDYQDALRAILLKNNTLK